MPKPNPPVNPDPNNPSPFPNPNPPVPAIREEQVYQELCARAAQIIKRDTRNPQVEKWWEDYEATL